MVFFYGACEPFTKKKERIQKFKEAGDLRYIYQNKLDKACPQHDMTFEDFKDLPGGKAYDKALHNKAIKIVKKSKYDGYQRSFAAMAYNFFNEMSSGGGNKHKSMADQQLAEVQSYFIDNIWDADLTDMHLISKFNKDMRFLLCVIDVFSKYA